MELNGHYHNSTSTLSYQPNLAQVREDMGAATLCAPYLYLGNLWGPCSHSSLHHHSIVFPNKWRRRQPGEMKTEFKWHILSWLCHPWQSSHRLTWKWKKQSFPWHFDWMLQLLSGTTKLIWEHTAIATKCADVCWTLTRQEHSVEILASTSFVSIFMLVYDNFAKESRIVMKRRRESGRVPVNLRRSSGCTACTW